MKFSIGVEYALHCLLYLVKNTKNNPVGIKELAEFQGISESYLSKVFTKLVKNNIVESVSGANGGYKLVRSPRKISFWDVIEAIEGKEDFFQCCEIRQKTITLDKDNLPDTHTKCPCTIKQVILEGESKMKRFLSRKNLLWLYNHVFNEVLPPEAEEETLKWFQEKKKKD